MNLKSPDVIWIKYVFEYKLVPVYTILNKVVLIKYEYQFILCYIDIKPLNIYFRGIQWPFKGINIVILKCCYTRPIFNVNGCNTPKISDAVVMVNKIVIHTLQFMKLYLLE